MATEQTSNNSQYSWEEMVFFESFMNAFSLVMRDQAPNLLTDPLPPFSFRDKKATEELAMLQSFYEKERRITAQRTIVFGPKAFMPGYTNLKNPFYKDLARDIRRRDNYSLFPRLQDTLAAKKDEIPILTRGLMSLGIATLYLLSCRPDSFVVGVRDGVHKKKVDLQFIPDPDPGETDSGSYQLIYAADFFLANLRYINARLLAVVPNRLIRSHEIKSVELPTTVKTQDDYLEDAYFNMRYIIPPEGGEVRLKGAKDIEGMFMMQSGNKVFTRLQTPKGETLVWISLDNTSHSRFEPTMFEPTHILGIRGSPRPFITSWSDLVAETYCDFVTAKNVPTNRYKPLRPSKTETLEGRSTVMVDSPQIIYIQRTASRNDVRLPYEGPPRPIRPHPVSGYRREGNMSETHRKRLLDFEREHDLVGMLVDKIPAGFTWARPHFSPVGSEAYLKHLPTFIKKRIVEEMTRPREIILDHRNEQQGDQGHVDQRIDIQQAEVPTTNANDDSRLGRLLRLLKSIRNPWRSNSNLC